MGEIIATAKRDIKRGEVVATILSPGTCYYEHGRIVRVRDDDLVKSNCLVFVPGGEKRLSEELHNER